MKLSRKALRKIILSEARYIVENSPEYMAMNYPNVDIGGSEALEFDPVVAPGEQEASLADLGERVTFNLKGVLDSLRIVVGDVSRMVDHPESQESGYEQDFVDDHASLIHALETLESAINGMK